jgi:hypothetical protein
MGIGPFVIEPAVFSQNWKNSNSRNYMKQPIGKLQIGQNKRFVQPGFETTTNG